MDTYKSLTKTSRSLKLAYKSLAMTSRSLTLIYKLLTMVFRLSMLTYKLLTFISRPVTQKTDNDIQITDTYIQSIEKSDHIHKLLTMTSTSLTLNDRPLTMTSRSLTDTYESLTVTSRSSLTHTYQ